MNRLLSLIAILSLLAYSARMSNAQTEMNFGDLPFGDNFFGVENPFDSDSGLRRIIGANYRDPVSDTSTYFSVFGGWNFATENDRIYGWFPSTNLDDGAVVAANFGRRFGPRLRSDIELAFRQNDVSHNYGRFFGYDAAIPYFSEKLSGDINTYSGMLNLYFDFDRAENRRVTPYVGAGIGLAILDTDLAWNGVGATMSNESVFAYQFIGGLATRIGPRSEFLVEYRFFATANDDFYVPPYPSFPNDEPTRLDYRYRTNNLFLGCRINY